MTRRERLKRCYFNEEVDRPAVYSRTGYPQNDPTYDRLKSYIKKNTELKVSWKSSCIEEEYKTEKFSEPYSDDYECETSIIYTPAGELRSLRFNSLKGKPGMTREYYIKSEPDAEKLLSLPFPRLINKKVSGFFELEKQISDSGITNVILGQNPAGHVAKMMGSETFAIMSMESRDMIHELCRRRMQILINRVKYLLEKGAGPFFSMLGEELITPPLHSPQDFFEFNVKYDKPIIDIIHEAGGRVHIHCHGSIKDVIQGFIDMGADVVHPFEAPPQGDILPFEAKEIIRDKICYEGNIQINKMYENTPEEIREETQNLIKQVFDDNKGLIVCPSASPYVRGEGEQCFKQYKAMIDTVLECKA